MLSVSCDNIFYCIIISNGGGGVLSTLVITAAFYRFEKGIYDQTVVSYYNGEYLEVEGYVENFDSQIIRGEVSEEFEINGVKFSYTNGKQNHTCKNKLCLHS